jgi:uncharacterized protein (DUF1330 family)
VRCFRSLAVACALAAAIAPSAPAAEVGLTAEQVAALGQRDPNERLALVELLTYRDAGGRERYASYVQRLGGRIVWNGRVEEQFIGRGYEGWDDIVVSEYDSVRGLLDGRVQVGAQERERLLAAARVYPAEPWPWYARAGARLVFGVLNWLGGGPEPARLGTGGIDPAEFAAGGDPLGPSREQVEAFAAAGLAKRVAMFNFLHFAAGPEPPAPAAPAGKEEYDRYTREVALLIGRVGGRLRWMGWPYASAAPDASEQWDQIAVVDYPSRAAFLGMLASPAYRETVSHRTAGLDRTALIACSPGPD